MVAGHFERKTRDRVSVSPSLPTTGHLRDNTVIHLSPPPLQVGCARRRSGEPPAGIALETTDVNGSKGEARVSVEKSIDLTATGSTIEQAVEEAVSRARLTLQGVTSFEIERIDGIVGEEALTYRVLVRISFVIKEHVHE